MINKQSVWFVTLFSLILVLSIYYVTMSDNSLKGILEHTNSANSETPVNAEVSESTILVSLRVEEEESVLKEMENLQSILLDTKKTSAEKSEAYNSLQALSAKKSLEDKIEKHLKDTLNLDSFVKVKDDAIAITICKSDHTASLANNIITSVQNQVKNDYYITVKFQVS